MKNFQILCLALTFSASLNIANAASDKQFYFPNSGPEDVTSVCGFMKSWNQHDQANRKTDARVPAKFVPSLINVDQANFRILGDVCKKYQDKTSLKDGAAFSVDFQVLAESNCRVQAEAIRNDKLVPAIQKADSEEFKKLCFEYVQEATMRGQVYSYVRSELKKECNDSCKRAEKHTDAEAVYDSSKGKSKLLHDLEAVNDKSRANQK